MNVDIRITVNTAAQTLAHRHRPVLPVASFNQLQINSRLRLLA